MNPTDYGNGMLWMGQFPQDRMILDDNTILSVGMSVMDDITQQTHSMVTIKFCLSSVFLVCFVKRCLGLSKFYKLIDY